MKRMILSVIGHDKPGIVAYVAKTLADLDCNIENVNQTTLQGTFAGVFTAACHGSVTEDTLDAAFAATLGDRPLTIHVDPINAEIPVENRATGQFVVTTRGPDGKGLVAGITRVLADHKANISSLQAYFKGGSDAKDNGMIYQVAVPADADLQSLRQDLRDKAQELGLEISIQHNDIFMAVNRI